MSQTSLIKTKLALGQPKTFPNMGGIKKSETYLPFFVFI